MRALAAEPLLSELLACPKKQRVALLSEERFHNSELLNLLEEECHASLLALERVTFSEAVKHFEAALPNLDGPSRPWLACGSLLGLALSHLGRGNPAEARSVREQAWRLYSDNLHEEAGVWLRWLEGQVAAGLGDTADAESLLDSVRRKFLTARRLPEATLATIDLGQALAESCRRAECIVHKGG